MEKKGISQETLKIIACVTMLLDHIGATVWPDTGLRLIGRLAFPIYCFLLAEGIFFTKNPRKYGLRLLVGMLLSELPFDIALFGGFTWGHQSVMVTLFLAFCMGMCMKKTDNLFLKALITMPFALAAEWLCTDYGGLGVLMAALFILTRDMPGKSIAQFLGLLLLCAMMPSATVFGISVQLFAAAAIVPISVYSGKKAKKNSAIQWAFYLFYPVHLAVLALIIR